VTIAADLTGLAVPLADLELLPGNPRRGDVEAVARSLRRFGQRKPIVARRDGTVIAGNHTLEAARTLGWPMLAVVWTDDDEATAKAFALADNRTGDLGTYDSAALLAFVEEVRAFDATLLEAASYSADDLVKLADGERDVDRETAEGRLLALSDVAWGEPAHVVAVGDVWQLGERHRLVVADLLRGWVAWAPLLVDDVVFLPYPGPYVALSEGAAKHPLLLVQPDVYVAGHILDKYAAIHGDAEVRRDVAA
jgi:ParB-like chromosome segregation protein Spo0J